METYKILGQDAPATTNLTSLYVVPSDTSAVISGLFICVVAGSGAQFSVAVRPSGASADNKQYVYKDVALSSGNAFSGLAGLSLGDGDSIIVRTNVAGGIAFNLFGVEITNE